MSNEVDIRENDILQRDPVLLWSFPGFLGSSQGFFEGMAVVSGHIGGEDNLGYGQRMVQCKKGPPPMT